MSFDHSDSINQVLKIIFLLRFIKHLTRVFSKHTRFLGRQQGATYIHLRLSEFLLAMKKSFIDQDRDVTKVVQNQPVFLLLVVTCIKHLNLFIQFMTSLGQLFFLS